MAVLVIRKDDMVILVWRKGYSLVEELVSMDVLDLMVVLAHMLVEMRLGLRLGLQQVQVVILDSC